jgi:hypothetical protein
VIFSASTEETQLLVEKQFGIWSITSLIDCFMAVQNFKGNN